MPRSLVFLLLFWCSHAFGGRLLEHSFEEKISEAEVILLVKVLEAVSYTHLTLPTNREV